MILFTLPILRIISKTLIKYTLFYAYLNFFISSLRLIFYPFSIKIGIFIYFEISSNTEVRYYSDSWKISQIDVSSCPTKPVLSCWGRVSWILMPNYPSIRLLLRAICQKSVKFRLAASFIYEIKL